MLSSFDIHNLFSRVLDIQFNENNINEYDVRSGVKSMKESYWPNPESTKNSVSKTSDFNKASFRCAYLHKYASLHTAITSEMMYRILMMNADIFGNILSPYSEPFRICSLGGGPGSDVIGVVSILHRMFGFFQCSVRIVDIMHNWKQTFEIIVDLLRYGNYGSLSKEFGSNYFDWSYLTANLLLNVDPVVEEAIRTADLVTMVKFVSAASCTKTETMLQGLFRMLKPGALVLFIDNAAGDHKRLFFKTAKAENMDILFGPLEHEQYTNSSLSTFRFGYHSCCSTIVTVCLMEKSLKDHDFRALVPEPSSTVLDVFPFNPENDTQSVTSSHMSVLDQWDSQSVNSQQPASSSIHLSNPERDTGYLDSSSLNLLDIPLSTQAKGDTQSVNSSHMPVSDQWDNQSVNSQQAASASVRLSNPEKDAVYLDSSSFALLDIPLSSRTKEDTQSLNSSHWRSISDQGDSQSVNSQQSASSSIHLSNPEKDAGYLDCSRFALQDVPLPSHSKKDIQSLNSSHWRSISDQWDSQSVDSHISTSVPINLHNGKSDIKFRDSRTLGLQDISLPPPAKINTRSVKRKALFDIPLSRRNIYNPSVDVDYRQFHLPPPPPHWYRPLPPHATIDPRSVKRDGFFGVPLSCRNGYNTSVDYHQYNLTPSPYWYMHFEQPQYQRSFGAMQCFKSNNQSSYIRNRYNNLRI